LVRRQEEINEHFRQLNITLDELPTYTGPTDYAKGFSKCTILKETPVYYSSSSNVDIHK